MKCGSSFGSRFNVDWFEHLTIVASNDINEETIISLNEQGHKIDSFGIGTHLGKCLLFRFNGGFKQRVPLYCLLKKYAVKIKHCNLHMDLI